MVRPWGSNTEGLSVTKTRARILVTPLSARSRFSTHRAGGLCGLPRRCRKWLVKHTFENVADVLQLLVEVERPLDFRGGQRLGNVRVCQQQRFEIASLVKRSHGVSLNPLVRLLAGNPF